MTLYTVCDGHHSIELWQYSEVDNWKLLSPDVGDLVLVGDAARTVGPPSAWKASAGWQHVTVIWRGRSLLIMPDHLTTCLERGWLTKKIT